MHYTRSLRVPVPAATLFAWHERPGAFERLSPPWQRVRVVRADGSLRDGARVELDAPLAPLAALDPLVDRLLPRRWVAEHRDYRPGEQFRDVQIEGPFARWSHLHRVAPDGPDASVLTDAIDLALPFGPLGALGTPVARAELDRLFTYRHAVTAADLARHAPHAARAPLTVAITGASGLVGAALGAFLTTGGHTVVRIGRGAPAPAAPQRRDVRWDPEAGVLDPAALDGVDAVVHLAGASVADRWTPAHKRAIEDSRVRGTTLVARTLAALAREGRGPRTLVSASAIGIYGDRGDEPLDETSAPGTGFLADVARRWEGATAPAEEAGLRVVHARIGVVLSAKGGALPRLMLPFQLGAGGKVGSGRQWMSLVALDDVVGALHHLLMHDGRRGAVNVVGPAPVTNAEFARVLGHVLGRPSFAAAPAFAIRLMLGREQADEMVLASQRVLPRALLADGFAFRHPTLEDALRFELGRAA